MKSQSSGFTVARLRKILERQASGRFHSSYVPSTLATRSEAPRVSRPLTQTSRKLGRDVHLMGQPEHHAFLLAAYHPSLFELHEQKMLQRWEAAHPLTGFPGVDATGLPAVRGTVRVAESLGLLHLHPTISLPDPQQNNRLIKVPFPYQGDLLLFLRDSSEKPYCVNWPIKATMQDFSRGGPEARFPESVDERAKALARQEIEAAYYDDAGIRTQPVADGKIDRNLSENLSQIYPYMAWDLGVDEGLRCEIVGAYRAAVSMGTAPLEVMAALVRRGRCSSHDVRTIFYQAIWNRELRVDLFSPVLPDYPVAPETVDVLDRYSDWFRP